MRLESVIWALRASFCRFLASFKPALSSARRFQFTVSPRPANYWIMMKTRTATAIDQIVVVVLEKELEEELHRYS